MASNSKVYLKRGNLNYKERQLIKQITASLEEKKIDMTNFKPANDFGQLQQLFDEYCVTDVAHEDVVEVQENTQASAPESTSTEVATTVKDDYANDDQQIGSEQSSFVDPFNRAEPTVRDYVMDEGMRSSDENPQAKKTSFSEPTSFSESYDIPDENGETSGSGGGEKKGGFGRKKEKPESFKAEPINPDFDKMENAKKRKSTKKMAKAIVDGVCKLAEFGCIWWVTKDITADKLIQYELEDTMDLNVLLSLDNNQEATVREFFAIQVKTADKVLRVKDEDKQDLIDSLYEVMLEKGIAPTPMQELVINAITTLVVGLGVQAFAMGNQINNVLQQLIGMRNAEKEQLASSKRPQNQFQEQTFTQETVKEPVETSQPSEIEHISDVEVVEEQSTEMTVVN